MIALLVMTDGRADLLHRAVESARANLIGDVSELWMHDDSGDAAYRAGLARRYPDFGQLADGGRRGFGGAIAHAWQQLAARSAADFVFHLEDDFVFRRPADLAAMTAVLHEWPTLAQLALRRQAWNVEERAAGGIVEQHPGDFAEVHAMGHAWLTHRRFFTTNPGLYRMSLVRQRPWPAGDHSEGRFGLGLLEHGTPEAPGPLVRFGFWGGLDSGEAVEHIGHSRVGTGY